MRTGLIRWLALLAVTALAGGSIYYEYQYVRPCARPIPFAIGAVDTRFEIANAEVKRTAGAAGKIVLAYDPEAKLKINLMYDEREEAARLGSQIAREQAEADTARAVIDDLQAQYAAALAAYDENVRATNARGGATRDEMSAFHAQQAALNASLDTIKGQVASYNTRIAAINTKVAQYNKNAGQTFREGEFVRDANGERINIFEFVGATQLTRVLAHEFGHAIGLGHNNDSKSIMYAENESGNLIPTAADFAALHSLCGS